MKLTILMALGAMQTVSTGVSAQETSQPKARDAVAAETHLIAPSEKVIGLDLATATDKDVGEVGDLLLDPKSGEIRYAIIEVGGFLGVGQEDRVVPWSLIQVQRDPDNADDLRARTTLTEEQVKNAPECKKGALLGADLDRRIEAVFGKNDAWAYVGEGPAAFARLSQVKGATVTGAQAAELGEIQDVVLAPQSACVAYVVLDTTEAAGDKHVAVPFSRMRITKAGENELGVSTELDARKLQSAPEYDAKEWKRMSSTAWMTEMSKHYESDPFWRSSRTASARRANTEK